MREQIKALPPGATVPTLQELMLTHGVSQTTIDRALASLRREGLVSRPAGKQRFVVNAVSDPACRRIAVVRPDYPSKVFDEVTRAVVDHGRKMDAKFDMVYYRSLQTLDLAHAAGDSDATVLVPTSEPFPDHLRAAAERPRQPLVLVQEVPPDMHVHAVHLDNDVLGQMAVEHLIDLGHRRIVFVNNEPPTFAGAERLTAWRKAMLAAGLEAGDDLVCDCGTRYFEDSLQAAYTGFGRWLREEREFTAVFVASSAVAGMAVMRALCERGVSVPEDVSVLSYCGEEPLGAFTNPPLTTLQLDMAGYGKVVSEMLEEQFRNPEAVRRHERLRPELVVRRSTAIARDVELARKECHVA